MNIDAPAPKKSKRHYLYIALAAVATLIVAAVIVSRSGLDKALLRQQMDAFAAALHSNGEHQGRDITLTYGEVDIKGSFSNKHGVIQDVKLTIKPLNKDGAVASKNDSLVVRTQVAEIYPKSSDLSAVQLRLPQPVDFSAEHEPEKKLLTIAANAPLTLDIVKTQENKVDAIDLTHILPTQTTFTYLRESQAEGAEDTTPTIVPVYRKLMMTLAEGGVIQSKFTTDDKGLGQSKIDLKDIQLQPELVPNGTVKITEIVGQWSNAINDKNNRLAELKLHIGDITASPDILPYAPISLVVDGTFNGLSASVPQDVSGIAAPQSSMKLTEFLISTKDAKLKASADFTTNAGDMLPEGTANITLTNVPYVLKELRDNGILNAQNEAMVVPILELTTGQKLAGITDAAIDIKRPRGGAFTIGKTTFEELLASFLKSALSASNAQPNLLVPSIPNNEDKKLPLKGTMIEDGGARA